MSHNTPAPRQFPGYRLMEVGETIGKGDCVLPKGEANLCESFVWGATIDPQDVGYYYRPLPAGEGKEGAGSAEIEEGAMRALVADLYHAAKRGEDCDKHREAIIARHLRAAGISPSSSHPQGQLLKRIDKHLTDWLNQDLCECEGTGHSCGKTEVRKTRDEVRALLAPSPESLEGK